MNGFISESPEDGGSFLWPCCQECGRQKACPYVYDQLLHHAAGLGRGSAKVLTNEADRLLQTLSYSNDLQRLLEGSRDLEAALSRALTSELDLADSLRAHKADPCQ